MLRFSAACRGLTRIQANITSTESTTICAEPAGPNVSPDDPNHSITGVNYQLFSTYHPNASGSPEVLEQAERMLGFVIEQEVTHGTYNVTRAADVIQSLPEDMIPVYRTMAENYVLFDNWFCDVPGPTNPNRYARCHHVHRGVANVS